MLSPDLHTFAIVIGVYHLFNFLFNAWPDTRRKDHIRLNEDVCPFTRTTLSCGTGPQYPGGISLQVIQCKAAMNKDCRIFAWDDAMQEQAPGHRKWFNKDLL
jgi:hypothetical protein